MWSRKTKITKTEKSQLNLVILKLNENDKIINDCSLYLFLFSLFFELIFYIIIKYNQL